MKNQDTTIVKFATWVVVICILALIVAGTIALVRWAI